MKQKIAKYEENLRKMQAERNETESDAEQLLKCIEELTAELEKDDENYDGK